MALVVFFLPHFHSLCFMLYSSWLFAARFSNCCNSLNFKAKINFKTTRQNDLNWRKTCTGLKFNLEHFNGPQNKFIGDSLYKHPVALTVVKEVWKLGKKSRENWAKKCENLGKKVWKLGQKSVKTWAKKWKTCAKKWENLVKKYFSLHITHHINTRDPIGSNISNFGQKLIILKISFYTK